MFNQKVTWKQVRVLIEVCIVIVPNTKLNVTDSLSFQFSFEVPLHLLLGKCSRVPRGSRFRTVYNTVSLVSVTFT
jgi:hypothetical protein